jgi:Flp pilus assembly protein TadD
MNRKEMIMREVIVAAALSATCLFSGPAYSQGNADAGAAAASPKVKSQLERAYRLKTDKKSAEAVAAFETILKSDPENHAATAELGYLHAGLKHWNSAVKYLGAASKQDESDMRLRMDLGYAYQALKNNDAARAEFARVAGQPGDFQAQAQSALEAMKGAPAAAPGDSKQRRLLDQGYAALRRGDKITARKRFEAAVVNDPKDGAALKQLGFVNLEEGKLSAAAANFEAARGLEPNDYFVALQLGYTYERLQKKDLARDAFNAALASTDAKIHDAAVAALKPEAEAPAGAAAPL